MLYIWGSEIDINKELSYSYIFFWIYFLQWHTKLLFAVFVGCLANPLSHKAFSDEFLRDSFVTNMNQSLKPSNQNLKNEMDQRPGVVTCCRLWSRLHKS
ncbi:hypothetical protein P8452_13533 [Trifolium repens]|nr:hypothetical protein P8452_13533 [Trifolium repens]